MLNQGLITKRGGGLGLYPGDSCYDPNKPWYWPNWMDSPLEQVCVTVQGDTPLNPPMPATPGVPVTGNNPTGAVTPAQAAAIIAERDAAATEATKARLREYFGTLAEELRAGVPPPAIEPCQWYQTEAASGACVTGGVLLWGLILGGGVLAIVIAAKR